MEDLTDEQVTEWKARIDTMSRYEMCRLWRFAKPGHPCFVTGTPVNTYFEERFKKLGGFSPEISKQLGW